MPSQMKCPTMGSFDTPEEPPAGDGADEVEVTYERSMSWTYGASASALATVEDDESPTVIPRSFTFDSMMGCNLVESCDNTMNAMSASLAFENRCKQGRTDFASGALQTLDESNSLHTGLLRSIIFDDTVVATRGGPRSNEKEEVVKAPQRSRPSVLTVCSEIKAAPSLASTNDSSSSGISHPYSRSLAYSNNMMPSHVGHNNNKDTAMSTDDAASDISSEVSVSSQTDPCKSLVHVANFSLDKGIPPQFQKDGEAIHQSCTSEKAAMINTLAMLRSSMRSPVADDLESYGDDTMEDEMKSETRGNFIFDRRSLVFTEDLEKIRNELRADLCVETQATTSQMMTEIKDEMMVGLQQLCHQLLAETRNKTSKMMDGMKGVKGDLEKLLADLLVETTTEMMTDIRKAVDAEVKADMKVEVKNIEEKIQAIKDDVMGKIQDIQNEVRGQQLAIEKLEKTRSELLVYQQQERIHNSNSIQAMKDEMMAKIQDLQNAVGEQQHTIEELETTRSAFPVNQQPEITNNSNSNISKEVSWKTTFIFTVLVFLLPPFFFVYGAGRQLNDATLLYSHPLPLLAFGLSAPLVVLVTSW